MRLLLTMDLLSQRIKCDAYFDPYLSPLSISFFRDTVRVTGFSRASFREGGAHSFAVRATPNPSLGEGTRKYGLIRFNHYIVQRYMGVSSHSNQGGCLVVNPIFVPTHKLRDLREWLIS